MHEVARIETADGMYLTDAEVRDTLVGELSDAVGAVRSSKTACPLARRPDSPPGKRNEASMSRRTSVSNSATVTRVLSFLSIGRNEFAHLLFSKENPALHRVDAPAFHVAVPV